MPTAPAKIQPHSCNGCDARWGGYNTAHCAGCHETFTGIGGFEKHRFRGACLDPATMVHGEKHSKAGELVFAVSGRAYPCWGWAESDAGRWSDDESE